MTLSSVELLDYRRSFVFPLQILEERSDRVALTVQAAEFYYLIEKNAIIGVGSWKTIKKVRLSRPLSESVPDDGSPPAHLLHSINSAASRTVHKETINGARRTFREYRHTGARKFNPILRAEYR